jgi:hypothetical protein
LVEITQNRLLSIKTEYQKVNAVARYPRIFTVDAFTLLIDFNRSLSASQPFGASPRLRSDATFRAPSHRPEGKIVGLRDKARIRPIARGDGSRASQLEEFFKKSSRDDKPEPPIGHPPRFHRFDPCRLRWPRVTAD